MRLARVPHRLLLALALAPALSRGHAASAAGAFVPDPRPGAPALDGVVYRVEAPGYAARLALLDDAAREKFLAARVGNGTDPFLASPRDGSPGFLSFLLELENRGGVAIHLEPMLCPITTPQGDIRSPLDEETLQTTYEMLDQKLPPAYAAAARALLSKPVTVAPGQTASGLIVYRTADLHTRTLRVEIQATTSSGETLTFVAPYRFVREKEKKAHP